MNDYFLKFPERKLQSEGGEETDEEADPELGQEPHGDLPHGVVEGVGLQQEEVEVEGHVEEVGHEGDLGDGQPEAPGEEVVDDPPVATAASECDPEQTEAPAGLAVSVEQLDLSVSLPGEVWPVHQHQPQCNDGHPYDDVNQAVDVDSPVLGEVQEVACHNTEEVGLIPAPGGKEELGQNIKM